MILKITMGYCNNLCIINQDIDDISHDNRIQKEQTANKPVFKILRIKMRNLCLGRVCLLITKPFDCSKSTKYWH